MNIMETHFAMKLPNGSIVTKLIVTGKLYRSNKRFVSTYTANEEGFKAAMMINLWNGSVWGLLNTGKRKLLKRVNN